MGRITPQNHPDIHFLGVRGWGLGAGLLNYIMIILFKFVWCMSMMKSYFLNVCGGARMILDYFFGNMILTNLGKIFVINFVKIIFQYFLHDLGWKCLEKMKELCQKKSMRWGVKMYVVIACYYLAAEMHPKTYSLQGLEISGRNTGQPRIQTSAPRIKYLFGLCFLLWSK